MALNGLSDYGPSHSRLSLDELEMSQHNAGMLSCKNTFQHTHLPDNEENDSHGSTDQGDDHQVLEPDIQLLGTQAALTHTHTHTQIRLVHVLQE